MNLHRLGRAVIFLAGSIVGGLALAFIIVFARPQLLQRPAAVADKPAAADSAPNAQHSSGATIPSGAAASLQHGATDVEVAAGAGTAPPSSAPALTAESYAAAVRRAAPAVVNISTARLVTEQIGPSALSQLFGDL